MCVSHRSIQTGMDKNIFMETFLQSINNDMSAGGYSVGGDEEACAKMGIKAIISEEVD